MRHLRAKQGRKTLNYFRLTFGIAPPYAVLLDGNFIHAATSHKIDIFARVKKHLAGEKFTFFVPACVIMELRALGAPVEGALEFAQAHCEILDHSTDDAVTPTEAIKAIIGSTNPRKFFVATQEDALRDHLRSIPTGVPLMHIQRTVLLLETPSAAARHKGNKDESAKLRGDATMADANEAIALAKKIRLQERSEKRRIDGAKTTVPKKEKAKGPNPLSCMKKKKPGSNVEQRAASSDSTPKKTRRGKKVKNENSHSE
jgi:U3 small nucleolar RNA-associated protein 23